MRGESERQATLRLDSTPAGFVPRDHPLRGIKPLVDSALRRMSTRFGQVDATGGSNRDADFAGERRSREAHISTTDPEGGSTAPASKRGPKLCDLGRALTENRHDLALPVEQANS